MTTGIVIAGGPSERFGVEDKALATLNGSAMLRHVVDRLAAVCDELVVNCRQEQRPAFEDVLGDVEVPIRIAVDPVQYAGPVAGLETALERVDDEVTIAIGCDAPFVSPRAFAELQETLVDGGDVDVVVPHAGGRKQPLGGVYYVDALAAAIDALGDTENASLFAILDRLEVGVVPADRLPGGERAFRNVNTRADLERVRTQE